MTFWILPRLDEVKGDIVPVGVTLDLFGVGYQKANLGVGKVSGFTAVDRFNQCVRFFRGEESQLLRVLEKVHAECRALEFGRNRKERRREFCLGTPQVVFSPFQSREKVLVVGVLLQPGNGNVVVSKKRYQFRDDSYLVDTLEQKTSRAIHDLTDTF